MKIIKHELHDSKLVVMLFDEIDIAYKGTLNELSKDPAFLDIAKRHGLTCDALRYGRAVLASMPMLCSTVDGEPGSEPVEVVYSVDYRYSRSVTVHKAYTQAAEEAFNLMTGKSLKTLWKNYCMEKGIPVPAT
jgi:hypothetical protein